MVPFRLVVAAWLAAAMPGPGAAAPVIIGSAASALGDPAVCPAEARAGALRAELASLDRRDRLPLGLSRKGYARLLRLRIAVAEQDEAALATILADMDDFDPNAGGVQLMLADIRGDPRLLADAARSFGDAADRWADAGRVYRPEADRERRDQADALRTLALAEPGKAAIHLAAAMAVLARLAPETPAAAAPGGADAAEAAANAAARADAIADLAGAADAGAGAAQLAAWRRLLMADDDPARRRWHRARLAALLIEAGRAGGPGAPALLAEAATLARDGEAELLQRLSGFDTDLLRELMGGITGRWVTPGRITNPCLQRAHWRALAAGADLLAAESDPMATPATIDAARQRLAAADRQRDGLPDWQHDAMASVLLAQSWLRSARAASSGAQPAPIAAARAASDRVRRFSARCFCPGLRREAEALAADPLLADAGASP